MTQSRLLLLTTIACSLASCTPVGSTKKDDGYDTTNPYGTDATNAAATSTQPPVAPGGNAANSETASYQPVNPVNPPANPTYAPAAYEDNSSAKPNSKPSAKPSTAAQGKTHAASATTPKPAAHVAASATAGANVHTVVAGDSLTKISHQYHVPIASIKAANHMTNDTVVIGKKLQIPAH